MRLGRLLPALCLLLTTQGQAAEVVDDAGNTIRLQNPATRLISLAPSLTELTYAIGAGDTLVGAIEFSDYPPAAQELPRVGRHDMLDVERILSLQPDLVLAWISGNPRASVRELRRLGLTVYLAEPTDLASIASQLRRLGRLTGHETEADSAAERFTEVLNRLRRDSESARPVSTFYQVWDNPVITAGGQELINDVISVCGGINVFADLRMVAPKVSVEAVLARAPEVIVASGADEHRPPWLDDWRDWSGLPAVENDHLYFIPPALVQRHTPRVLQGAEMMCEYLDGAR